MPGRIFCVGCEKACWGGRYGFFDRCRACDLDFLDEFNEWETYVGKSDGQVWFVRLVNIRALNALKMIIP